MFEFLPIEDATILEAPIPKYLEWEVISIEQKNFKQQMKNLNNNSMLEYHKSCGLNKTKLKHDYALSQRLRR